MRELKVLADGTPFAGGCRFHLSGKVSIGLYPSLFLLEAWNLSDADAFRLRRGALRAEGNPGSESLVRTLGAWQGRHASVCLPALRRAAQ